MGPPRRGGGKRQKGKAKSNRNIKGKRPAKQRKTYSIYKLKNQTENSIDVNAKRKTEVFDKERENKRQKIESNESEVESDEEVIEDNIAKLLDTFGGKLKNKASEAIESSDDSDTSSDEDEKDIEKENNTVNEESIGSSKEIDDKAEASSSDEESEDKGLDSVEDNDLENLEDNFNLHLAYELNSSLLNSLQSTPMIVNNHTENWPCLGKLSIQIPHSELQKPSENKFSITGDQKFAPPGKIPTIYTKSRSAKLSIKSQIIDNIQKANPSLNSVDNGQNLFTPFQNEIFSIIDNYQDFYYTHRSFSNAEELRFAYCVHAVNHVLKTRMKVIHHNARLSKKDDVPEDFRDQGLVRPKVLIMVPFRDAAYRIIQFLINILVPEDKGNVINKNRFIQDYTGNQIAMPKKNPKPEDYEMLFSGNTGDDFKIGITVTKKSLKLYADFYSADIIIASPLGLRFTIGAEGEPDRDYDFLSSIELLILDQTEIFLMQNWDHLLHIFNHLHLQPKDSHGTDFSRVRTWSLDGHSKYYRQTLVFSSLVLPEINAIFNKRCSNYAGKVRVSNGIVDGTIGQVFVQLPHVFHKIVCGSVEQGIDARFEFFVNKVLPQYKEPLMKQTLVFVPNYFDYVRVRNYFKKEDVSFVQICEYSKEGKIARARDMFFHGDAHFLLYTERYHFFNRIRIKGIRHLIFYQPPNFPNFYYEMCNLMQEANMNKKVGNMSNMTVTVLYTKYDVHQLAAIVTTERVGKMIQSDRNVHMMVTGSD